jgi:hypothetical protein
VGEGERHVGVQQGVERFGVAVGVGECAGGAVEQLVGALGDDGDDEVELGAEVW